jgi:phosphoserine phosphatase
LGKYLQKGGIDYVHANELEIIDKLTVTIWAKLSMVKKARYLQAIANKEGIHINQTIAVVMASNDLPYVESSGLGIAFHAKPTVRKSRKFYF